jgi:hypothetical protein
MLESIQLGWSFLFHPRESVDRLGASPRAPQLAWSFLLLCVTLWALVTGYVNIVLGETARGREVLLDMSLGPDILMTLLTIPLGVTAVGLAALCVSTIGRWMGGDAQFKPTFYTLSFSLNAGSIFIDYPHEVGWALTGEPWKLHECVPGFTYWAAFVMFAPIVWSLAVTIASLAHLYRLSWVRALLSFLLGVLPIFAALIFLVA